MPLPDPTAIACALIISTLTKLIPAGRSKRFVWRKIGSAKLETLPSQKADLGRYYSPRFVVKKMYETLARPG